MVFEALIGKSYNGDISLDDLTLVAGECPRTETCDFEADLCDYEQDKGLQWIRGQPSKETIDHTTLTNKVSFCADMRNLVYSLNDR